MIVFYACGEEDGTNIYNIQNEEVEIRTYNEEERNQRNDRMNRWFNAGMNGNVHAWVNNEWRDGERMVLLPDDAEWWGDERPVMVPEWMVPGPPIVEEAPATDDESVSESESLEFDEFDHMAEREFGLLARLYHGYMTDQEAERERVEDERMEMDAVRRELAILEWLIPDWYDSERDRLSSEEALIAGAYFHDQLTDNWLTGGLREPYPWESELLMLYQHLAGVGTVCFEEWRERRTNGCVTGMWPRRNVRDR